MVEPGIRVEMSDQRCSDSDESKRDIPSFIEPRPPLIANPFMRPRPQKGRNLLELFEEDSEGEEPEWVQVYLRLKPCSEPSGLYEVKSDRCLITSVDTATAGHGRRTQHHISKMYTFSHIFGPESNQKDIFEHVVKDNLRKLPEGHSFTLLAYGASGSGKTYTLMGTVGSPGLVPRALEYVFQLVDAAQAPLYKPGDGGAETLSLAEQEHELQWVQRLRQAAAPARDKYRRMSSQLRAARDPAPRQTTSERHYVWVSFIEIYNEGIYDLLSNSDRSKSASKLRIREDANGNVYVKGALQAFVRSGAEAYDVLVRGKHALQVAATGVHARSSRSHCIFTITMLSESGPGGCVRGAQVRLCDLAGCERARQTRNTGARMQESRAINASLHVLERCLHMLRRKQRLPLDASLVPYRESKLTRLLGAGLGGARRAGAGAEAVAMVVTLNPAPQFAHETRHVLQLAAVARDIQVNATLAEAESTLESTASQPDSPGGGALERLRADNERLHFELAQAHACISEQSDAMAARREHTARTMHEILEEAKDMTRQYYEPQLQALRAEVSQLLSQIAILEENLSAERLARASEVRHLRACLEERDAKTPECASDVGDEDSLSESEEDDSAKESLEPTFRKEDINRSRLLQRSLIDANADAVHTENTTDAVNHCDYETIELDSDADSVVDRSSDTLKDDSLIESTRDSTYDTGESEASNKLEGTYDHTSNVTHNNDNTDSTYVSIKDGHNSVRGTYCIQNLESPNICEDEKTKTSLRGTYFVSDAKVFSSSRDERESVNDAETEKMNMPVTTNFPKIVDKISNISEKSSHESDVSLAQFEQLEKATKKIESSAKTNTTFTDIQSLKETKMFFEDNFRADTANKISHIKKTYFDNVDVASGEAFTKVSKKLNLIAVRSPSIVKGDFKNDLEPNKTNKLLERNYTKQPDIMLSSQNSTVLSKKHVSVDIFEGFDSPNVFTTDDKIDETKSAYLMTKETTQKDKLLKSGQTKEITDKVNSKLLKSDQTKKITDKVNSIDVDFEELHEDVKVRHNLEIADLVKSFEDKSTNSKETTDLSTITKPHSSQAKDETNDIKTHLKLKSTKTANMDLDQESGNQKQIYTKHGLKQEPSDQTMEITDKVNSIHVGFEKLHEDIVKVRHNVEIADLVKGFEDKSVNSKETTDLSTTTKPHSSQAKDETNDIKTHLKLKSTKTTNIDLDQESDNQKQIYTKHSLKQEPSDLMMEITDKINSIEKLQEDIVKVRHNVEIADLVKSFKDTSVNSKDITDLSTITKPQSSQAKDETKDLKSRPKLTTNIDLNQESGINMKHGIQHEPVTLDKPSKESPVLNVNDTQENINCKENNTIDEFDNIYKDITAPRATEFELLISQEVKETDTEPVVMDQTKPKYNLRQTYLSVEKKEIEKPPKRNLRLRRVKTLEEDAGERNKECTKLKDIVNLQREFSDVTLDVPAARKRTQDIASPERRCGENRPPLGLQSCPIQSVPRSRRKLFTPRAEPPEESAGSGDSAERVRVPRPSYRRGRARRKL